MLIQSTLLPTSIPKFNSRKRKKLKNGGDKGRSQTGNTGAQKNTTPPPAVTPPATQAIIPVMPAATQAISQQNPTLPDLVSAVFLERKGPYGRIIAPTILAEIRLRKAMEIFGQPVDPKQPPVATCYFDSDTPQGQ